jgi:hypothetical protein
MKKASVFSKILVIAGTILVLLPIAFMVVTAVVGSVMRTQFLWDYMIPGEVFPIVLAGMAVLMWAALREHTLVKAIGWTAGGTLFLLIASQALAVITGLANGTIALERAPFWMAVVSGMLIAYDLGVAWMGYWGIKLWASVFAKKQSEAI